MSKPRVRFNTASRQWFALQPGRRAPVGPYATFAAAAAVAALPAEIST